MFNIWEKPHFPSPSEAGPDGLLITGGSLAPAWMMEAYKSGIFPMPLHYENERTLGWFSPDPRGILELDALHVSRRLARRLRRGQFQFTMNAAFSQVVEACAAPRPQDTGCWLTLAMQNAYLALHQLGAAHSVEVWTEGVLVGGVFGSRGGFFAGNRCSSRQTDASKAALVSWSITCAAAALHYRRAMDQRTHADLGRSTSRDEYLRRLASNAADKLPISHFRMQWHVFALITRSISFLVFFEDYP
jgi:leucyl/phenylalanyl-tRNA--protein transferase